MKISTENNIGGGVGGILILFGLFSAYYFGFFLKSFFLVLPYYAPVWFLYFYISNRNFRKWINKKMSQIGKVFIEAIIFAITGKKKQSTSDGTEDFLTVFEDKFINFWENTEKINRQSIIDFFECTDHRAKKIISTLKEKKALENIGGELVKSNSPIMELLGSFEIIR